MIYIGKFARILFCRGGDQRSAMSFVHLVPIYSSDRLSHVIKTFFFYMRCRFRVRIRYFVLFFFSLLSLLSSQRATVWIPEEIQLSENNVFYYRYVLVCWRGVCLSHQPHHSVSIDVGVKLVWSWISNKVCRHRRCWCATVRARIIDICQQRNLISQIKC